MIDHHTWWLIIVHVRGVGTKSTGFYYVWCVCHDIRQILLIWDILCGQQTTTFKGKPRLVRVGLVCSVDVWCSFDVWWMMFDGWCTMMYVRWVSSLASIIQNWARLLYNENFKKNIVQKLRKAIVQQTSRRIYLEDTVHSFYVLIPTSFKVLSVITWERFVWRESTFTWVTPITQAWSQSWHSSTRYPWYIVDDRKNFVLR